ncbi:actin-like protein Arp8 [Schizosaccharomyces japonicus yFS275]|uniref:Actin-like protein Arp8 n=1 Tax=Schizosaccharomyces japonicus (strain yFS275 / FY16936) TaxID=402676 RepID=B6JYF0_SCHJY|nr:actin-like protein Arp8 [Schizosaccharomyces japonicus yFS275]EEB06568.1 actin-like protein Arp8 [Schizosaccharomyces japonicus yFS275]
MPPKRKHSEVEENVTFKFTQFGIVPPINQKNFSTEYMKRDHQMLIWRDEVHEKNHKETESEAASVVDKEERRDEDEDEEENAAKNATTVVIHIGSRNLRLGFAVDGAPKVVPMVVARRFRPARRHPRHAPKEQTTKDESGNIVFDKERLKMQKKRFMTNGLELVHAYNETSKPEVIAEHDDPNPVQWIEPTKDVYVGDEALRLASNDYTLLWPIQHGLFNEADYDSPQQLLADLLEIFRYAMTKVLEVPETSLPQYSAIFIVPDLYDRVYVQEVITLLLHELHFGRLSVVQESLCTSFGAGMSTACIVDVGAQRTSVSCVDEGVVIANSRINLHYGGDDLTILLMKLLTRNQFPLPQLDLSRPSDWSMAESIKTQYCTVNEANCTVQLCEAYVREMHEPPRKLSFKVLDETMMTPMGYFRPDIFESENKLVGRHTLFAQSVDLYDGQPNNPESLAETTLLQVSKPIEAPRSLSETDSSKAQPPTSVRDVRNRPRIVNCGTLDAPEFVSERLVYPLDDAVNQSIFNACDGNLNDDHAKELYSSILVVGGGGHLPGFGRLLEERLKSKRANIPGIAVIPPPRQKDGRDLSWRGGCIYNRIKINSEFWIKERDWMTLGLRVLQYKTLGYFWSG